MAQSAACSSASTGVHHAPFKYRKVAYLPEPWRGDLTVEELKPVAAQHEVPVEKVVQGVVEAADMPGNPNEATAASVLVDPRCPFQAQRPA